MEKTKKVFVPPLLKVVEVKVEKGFATSQYGDGGVILGAGEDDSNGEVPGVSMWRWMDKQNMQRNSDF